MKTLIFLTLLISSLSLLAAEADHYSDPNKSVLGLEDANTILVEKTNEFVQKKLETINAKTDCSQMKEEDLYKELQDIFANHSKGKLVKDILYTDKYPTIKIPLEDSIYGSWSIRNGFLLGRKKAAESPLALAPLIRVGDVIVGTDKLEHLFGMGYQYFERHYLKGHSLKRVLKRGIFFEKTILGGNVLATGVFAYSDLAANFNGMRFWNSMLQKRDDVLGAENNVGPYLACEQGKWVQLKDIDFTPFLDEASDESINCSKFASRGGVKKYKKYLQKRGASCPRRPDLFSDLMKKYDIPTQGDKKARPLSHWILNDEGNGKVSYLNEF